MNGISLLVFDDRFHRLERFTIPLEMSRANRARPLDRILRAHLHKKCKERNGGRN